MGVPILLLAAKFQVFCQLACKVRSNSIVAETSRSNDGVAPNSAAILKSGAKDSCPEGTSISTCPLLYSGVVEPSEIVVLRLLGCGPGPVWVTKLSPKNCTVPCSRM